MKEERSDGHGQAPVAPQLRRSTRGRGVCVTGCTSACAELLQYVRRRWACSCMELKASGQASPSITTWAGKASSFIDQTSSPRQILDAEPQLHASPSGVQTGPLHTGRGAGTTRPQRAMYSAAFLYPLAPGPSAAARQRFAGVSMGMCSLPLRPPSLSSLATAPREQGCAALALLGRTPHRPCNRCQCTERQVS